MFRKKIIQQRYRIFTVVLSLALILAAGCERDDICPASTNTTPLLRISFFDFEETDIPKPPTNLRIRELDQDIVVINRESVSEMTIPLRTDLDITDYAFIFNAPVIAEGEEEPVDAQSNVDRVTFTYSREEEYINRACSFKMNFLSLRANLVDDGNNWIRNIIVEEENIEDETETHILIYH